MERLNVGFGTLIGTDSSQLEVGVAESLLKQPTKPVERPRPIPPAKDIIDTSRRHPTGGGKVVRDGKK